MKKWFKSNVFYFIGAGLGAAGGYAYWYFVGCSSGTCAITSSPLNSTIYFAAVGALALSTLKKSENKQQHG
jgi:hypothetical protein